MVFTVYICLTHFLWKYLDLNTLNTLSVSCIAAWLYLCSRGCHTWIPSCWGQVEDAPDWLEGTPSKTIPWGSTQHVLSEGIPGLLHSQWQKPYMSVREWWDHFFLSLGGIVITAIMLVSWNSLLLWVYHKNKCQYLSLILTYTLL